MREDAERVASERAAARIRTAAAPVRAPQSLRAAVAEDRLAAAPRPRAGRRPLVLAGLGAAAAAAALALLVAGSPGTPEGGSVADAAQVALRAPTAPAPARGPAGALRPRTAGLAFPDYARERGWRPVGARTDRIGRRRAVTVVYGRGAQRVGYTIVGGAPLAVPAGAQRLTYEGVDVAVLRRGDARYITWERDGHTCVLATRGAALSRLLEFAATRPA